MLIAARNGFAVDKPLPYDAEVKYLESTGTQQIDTGIIPTPLDSYFLDIMSTTTSGSVGIWYSFIGKWDAVPNKWLFVKLHGGNNTEMVQIWSFASSGDAFLDVVPRFYNINNIRSSIIISLKDKYASFTNKAVTGRINISVGEPALNQPSINLINGRWTGRIYGWRVNRGESTIQECVPVRFTNEQGVSEGAMYDRLGTGGMNPDGSPRTDGLYRNRGTGAFVIGPDL